MAGGRLVTSTAQRRCRFPIDQGPAPPGSRDGAVAGRVVVATVVQALLELLLSLTQRTSELRQLGSAEQQEDHEEDDDQFGRAQVHPAERSGGRREWQPLGVLECVINISEGRDADVLAAIADTAGDDLLDLHTDAHHHRSVLTLVGEAAARRVATEVVARIDLRGHDGVHPRIGVVDVVPFVALAGATMADAIDARDRFCEWAAAELALPCFRYGPERSLPDIRRQAFADLVPDCGPPSPHPTAGACAVGARELLVAYNLWLADADADVARRTAAAVRGDGIRALGLQVGDRMQVSMNLIEPMRVGPAEAWDRVAALAGVQGAELVGLVPQAVLAAAPRSRWEELDLAPDRTIESRLAARRDG